MERVETLRIWDIWIRLFHWSLALSVGFLLYTGLTGQLFFDWHKVTGEFVLMLILFRLVWGVLGSSNARLWQLFRSPLQAAGHIRHVVSRNVAQERGHNAAGSWAVLAMLLILGTQAITGLFIADEDEFVEGAFYGSVNSGLSDFMFRVHHINAELIQIVLVLHVGMVFLYLLYAKVNLVRPMITGNLRWLADKAAPDVKFQRWWIGALCLFACAAATGLLVGWF